MTRDAWRGSAGRTASGQVRTKIMPDGEMFLECLEMRRAVHGDAYVDTALAGWDDFTMTFQRLVTELA